MFMKTVMITGANRGLGLEFAKQYAAEGQRVIACTRNPASAAELHKLAQQYSNVTLETLDVADFQQIDQLAQKLKGTPIDILINNAGVYGDTAAHSFGQLDYLAWMDTLRINTLAPVKMAEAFVEHLQLSNTKLLVAISSMMGSMADNTSGGSLLYRSSKAGLNASMKSLALDLQKHQIGVLIFHPGWVLTDMGGPNALIQSPESIQGMREQIAQFEMAQTGCFIKYNGQVMPW